MKRYLLTIVTIISILTGAVNPSSGQELALFQDTEPIKLTLVTDVVALQNDKSEDPQYIRGMIIHHLSEYKFKSFEIKVKARGNTRRVSGLCEFPPLKFNFKKGHLKNTIFDGQDKLKFVSQCRAEEEFRDYLLEEYLLYQTYQIISPNSYRTRLVNIEIKDESLRVPTITMTGFLIEDDKLLAKRTESKSFDGSIHSQDSCVNESVDILSMFQYMIGNTDWYINTKHNIDVFQKKKDGSLFPVPFDFDYAGVINTPYAKPSKEIPINRVKQRYFKGSCRMEEAYDPVIDLFNSKQEAIYTLYNSFELLSKPIIKKSIRYYNKFYKIINDPTLTESSFYSACNSPFGYPINISR